MSSESSWINKYVIKNILVNNSFNISTVNDIKDIKSIYFDGEDYIQVEELIKKRDIEGIKQLSQGDNKKRSEYLYVLTFLDQNQKSYVVTVYDNDELGQDPQIIEIYRV